jgi:uncharacterized membrane protein YdjX (TVP38/TMEM64 family)
VDISKKKTCVIASLFILTALLGVAAFFAVKLGYIQNIIGVIDSDISPLLFILLMILLPLVGFPISVFLVVAGIKFDIPATVALWLVILPIHTQISYTAAKNLRPFLVRLLKNSMGYTIPSIPPHREAEFSFLFLAIPGLPYAVKNYLLPLAGAPFRYCVIMNCIVQGALGLPFIILGKSGAEKNSPLFYSALLSIVVLFIMLRWLKRKYGNRITQDDSIR